MAEDDENGLPTAWLIRAGRSGEREDYNLEHGLASCGWGDVPDLAGLTSRDDIEKLLRESHPDAPPKRIVAWASQLWRLREQVQVGDLVVMPLKRIPQIAFGTVRKSYWYNQDDDPNWAHTVSVDWKRRDVPRTAVNQDLLHSLGSALTICAITRNDGRRRLHGLLATGIDPGARIAWAPSGQGDGAAEATQADQGEEESTASDIDREQVEQERIRIHIEAKFKGHKLSELVAELLRAEGFTVDVATPGPDGGIDAFAGQGPLGLDNPRVVVQVKSSPSPVDVRVVRELDGVLSRQNADQGLLVAWGGVNLPARKEMRSQFFRVRVWSAVDVIDAVLRNYDKLEKELQAELPLKRIWTLLED